MVLQWKRLFSLRGKHGGQARTYFLRELDGSRARLAELSLSGFDRLAYALSELLKQCAKGSGDDISCAMRCANMCHTYYRKRGEEIESSVGAIPTAASTSNSTSNSTSVNTETETQEKKAPLRRRQYLQEHPLLSHHPFWSLSFDDRDGRWLEGAGAGAGSDSERHYTRLGSCFAPSAITSASIGHEAGFGGYSGWVYNSHKQSNYPTKGASFWELALRMSVAEQMRMAFPDPINWELLVIDDPEGLAAAVVNVHDLVFAQLHSLAFAMDGLVDRSKMQEYLKDIAAKEQLPSYMIFQLLNNNSAENGSV
jgi:hypothetical protein